MNQSFMMDQSEIQSILPHRYPFLLVDRVTEFVRGERIAGVKTFAASEPYVPGHFPGVPLVPCSILLEMTTQLGAVLVLERPDMAGKIAVILQIPSAHMYSLVEPGELVRSEAQILKWRGNFGELSGAVYREGALVAEGRMRFAVAPATELMSGKVAAHGADLPQKPRS
ncbi:MAG: 3-hydroxyacyl-ACP dehydratase FabZ family protein [Terriglobia bacterium]